MVTNHIPAWKRLGLKLKSQQDSAHSSPPTANLPMNGPNVRRDEQLNYGKPHPTSNSNTSLQNLALSDQRQERYGTTTLLNQSAASSLPKRKRSDGLNHSFGGADTLKVKRRKSVTFAPDTKIAEGDATSSDPTEEIHPFEGQATVKTNGDASQKNGGGKAVAERQQRTDSTQPAYLDYLEQYHTARSEWRFNKNKQTSLLKYATDVEKLPEQHGEALGAYVEGLQGAQSRDRLQTAAIDLLEEVRSASKEAGDGSTDSDDAEPQQRKEWRAQALRDQLTKTKQRLRDARVAKKEKSEAYQQRLKRRQRAEEILLALAQSAPPHAASSLAGTHGVSAAPAQHIRFEEASFQNAVGNSPTPDARPPKVKGSRRSKIRTGVPDDDDSSSSDSDIESLPSENEVEDPSTSSSDSQASDGSESSDSDSDSDSGTSELSAAQSSETETKVDIKQDLGRERLDKKAIRQLIQKQNGATVTRPPATKGSRTAAPAEGRKKRAFNTSSFYRG